MSGNNVESKLLDVLSDLKGFLRAEDFQEAVQEAQAGEDGVAFEVICQQLFEYGIGVPQRVYEKLQAIGELMELPESDWKFLQSLIIP